MRVAAAKSSPQQASETRELQIALHSAVRRPGAFQLRSFGMAGGCGSERRMTYGWAGAEAPLAV